LLLSRSKNHSSKGRSKERKSQESHSGRYTETTGSLAHIEEERHMMTAINFTEKFSKFSEHWSPKIIAQMNDYHFKLVKFQGEFVWHDHKDTDEVFIVLDGEMTIHFRDGNVSVKKGEMFVIPKGTEHKTSAKSECCAMLVETAGTVNTGDAGGDRTAPTDAWI
jgi:mannose-6-phosphate isomerase-like protein (cupin superfamily)